MNLHLAEAVRTDESGDGAHDENPRVTARIELLMPLLEDLARDLAAARCEVAALTRENARLRAQLQANPRLRVQLAVVGPAAAITDHATAATAAAVVPSDYGQVDLTTSPGTVRAQTATSTAVASNPPDA
jgi:hypothetical protein